MKFIVGFGKRPGMKVDSPAIWGYAHMGLTEPDLVAEMSGNYATSSRVSALARSSRP